MMRYFLIIFLFLSLCLSMSLPAQERADAVADYRVLFDHSRDENHHGVPWVIDDDEPLPLPEHPWGDDGWRGPLSDLAQRLRMTGRYSLETLPPEGSVTWLKNDNSQDLSLFDLFVICEPHRSFSPEEVSAIRSFLDSGGSIVLAGSGDDEVGHNDSADYLNELLNVLVSTDAGRRTWFTQSTKPLRGVRYIPEAGADDPVIHGPFGAVSRLSSGHGLRLNAWSDAASVLTGPEGEGRGPLYLVTALGSGKIALVSDPYLLTSAVPEGGEVDNIDFSLNLIAYLLEDRYTRSGVCDVVFEQYPEIRLITDDGASVCFTTSTPVWPVVELDGEGDEGVAYGDLDRDHALRLDDLRQDRDYTAVLYLYDGWGNGPCLSSTLSFETDSRSEIEYGDVSISEVFWGGENQYVELANSLDRTVDLRGWTLMNNGARHHLDGWMEKGERLLLSNGEFGGTQADGSFHEIIIEDLLLDRDGDFVILQDDDGNVVSTANMAGERWPAGSRGTDGASMERVSLDGPDEPGNWETAVVADAEFQGTPGCPNSRRSVRVFNPSFTASLVEGGIRLTWENRDDEMIEGINLYRSELQDHTDEPSSAEYTRLNDAPVPQEKESFLDTNLQDGIAYQYLLGVVYRSGEELFSEPLKVIFTTDIPASLKVDLGQNYPNPFNPQTEITFSLEEEEADDAFSPLEAKLSIYNIRGQQIRNLMEREVGPGRYSVRWDGRDDNGGPVSSGSYYYMLTVSRTETQEVVLQLSKKMVLLR